MMLDMLVKKNNNDKLMKIGSLLTSLMLVRAVYAQYLPQQWREAIRSLLLHYTDKIARFFSPYLDVIFDEYTGDRFNRSKVFRIIETYLSETASMKAKRLKASFEHGGQAVSLRLGDNEDVTDEFQGVKVWWKTRKIQSPNRTISVFPGSDERRYYRLTFHGRHRALITDSYLKHVLEEGKAIAARRRQRKLFTNVKGDSKDRSDLWSHVEFKHPATFDTLAMDPSKKRGIIDDLFRFSQAKDYYHKIGKPWKRGYLLYGPPGTGKSTMIVAMANLLEYDIYDLELTAVKDNTQLRRLLIETSSKSIIVIEDIDCSLDLTGQRSKTTKKMNKGEEDNKDEDHKELVKKVVKQDIKEDKKSEVTLSGLLNFIDGLWSACGEERLVIFTTNHINKLDPALIRRGRMDMHIELSYCCYNSFKVLARNYLDVDSHPMFETIRTLLEETKMTPADVAENLMPKSLQLDVEACLGNLVSALQKAKEEEEELKLENEERKKEGERERLKAQEASKVDNGAEKDVMEGEVESKTSFEEKKLI